MENEANPPSLARFGEYPEIPVTSITVGHRLRKLRPNFLEYLTENVSAHGLKTPISVAEVAPSDRCSKSYVLVTGYHRLEAYKRLGRETIPAHVHVMGGAERQLWEIDENHCREELTEFELGEHLQKR